MIQDYEMWLTPLAGQLFDPGNGLSEYGSPAYDQLVTAPGDPAVGEPLYAYYQVLTADATDITSLTFEIMDSTTGASGGTETSLISSGAVGVADLTVANGAKLIGVIPPGIASRRYLCVKVTEATAGASLTTGTIICWLSKGPDSVAVNAGVDPSL